MAYARRVGNAWEDVGGGFLVGQGGGAICYPPGWADGATAEEREALGLRQIEEPPPAPAYAQVIGSRLTGDTAPRREWVTADYTVDEFRAIRWTEAKAHRDHVSTSGCITPLGRVDTDADSQRKIVGAATAALIARTVGQPFTVNWTMQDNSVVPHDADQMIAMGMAVVAFLGACQDAGTAVRAGFLAAQDNAALAAVDITAGYPPA